MAFKTIGYMSPGEAGFDGHCGCAFQRANERTDFCVEEFWSRDENVMSPSEEKDSLTVP